MRARRIVVPLLIVIAAALVRAVTAEAVATTAPIERRSDRGTLRIEAIDERSGAALPVRIRAIPRSLLRDEQVLVAGHGAADLALEPGGYRVLVTHGPEWSVSEQHVEMRAGTSTKLLVPLTRLVDGSDFTACELHMHSSHSPDSEISLDERIASLLAEDVQFAVVTDHNVVTDAQRALAAAGIGTLPGLEVTTWAPEFGHFNVFPRTSAPRYAGTSPDELLHEVRSDPQSFIQINHPRLEPHIGYFSLAGYVRELGRSALGYPLTFDAVEVWNGYDLSAPHRRDEIFRDWLSLVARGQRITATGGSDAHATSRPPYVGTPRTYVRVPRAHATRAGEVLSALKQGRSFVSNGPLLDAHVLGRTPGESAVIAEADSRLTVEVQLESPAWMGPYEVEVWLGEQRVFSQALQAPAPGALTQRATVRVQIAAGRARSLVVVARGQASMRSLLGRDAQPYAFTNPIWLQGS